MYQEHTIQISSESIKAIASEYREYAKHENGSIYYQSDVEDAISDITSDLYEAFMEELPRLLTNPNKTIDFAYLIKKRTAKLIEVDNDRLYQVA